jgi:hypothetical protein
MGQTARSKLTDMYLEYVNDYLSVEKFAEHNGLSFSHAKQLLELAKTVYESPHPDA